MPEHIDDRLRGIEDRLARIEVRLDRLIRDVCGNGQPGRLDTAEQQIRLCTIEVARIRSDEKALKLPSRVMSLERWRWGLGGALAALAMIVSMIAAHHELLGAISHIP